MQTKKEGLTVRFSNPKDLKWISSGNWALIQFLIDSYFDSFSFWKQDFAQSSYFSQGQKGGVKKVT